MRNLTTQLILALITGPLACAHQQPTTLVVLDVRSDQVTMNLHVPLNELELAFGHDVTLHPKQTMAHWRGSLEEYLTEHIRPVTADGRPWSVQVRDMTIGDAKQTQSGPFQEVLVRLSLAPPTGVSPRNFILRYDVIMHQVVTHKALVSVASDWKGGRIEPSQVGVIAVNTSTSRIEPFAIQLGEGSWWTGFRPWPASGRNISGRARTTCCSF